MLKLYKEVGYTKTIRCNCGEEGCFKSMDILPDGEFILDLDESDSSAGQFSFQLPDNVMLVTFKMVDLTKESARMTKEEMHVVYQSALVEEQLKNTNLRAALMGELDKVTALRLEVQRLTLDKAELDSQIELALRQARNLRKTLDAGTDLQAV